MRAAARKAAIAAKSCATCLREPATIPPDSIMYRARSRAPARPWNWRARRSVLARKVSGASRGSRKSPSVTIAQLHVRDPQHIAQREHDKWHFVPPGGESYQMVSARIAEWYESLATDTVVTAHGGTARGLIAHLGIVKPAAAPLLDIAQGVVYVFEGERLTRHA